MMTVPGNFTISPEREELLIAFLEVRKERNRLRKSVEKMRDALKLCQDYLSYVEGKGEGGTSIFDTAKGAVDHLLSKVA